MTFVIDTDLRSKSDQVRTMQSGRDSDTYSGSQVTEKFAIDFLTRKIICGNDHIESFNAVFNARSLFCPFSFKA